MIGRIPILDVSPAVDGGRWPAKAVPGESIRVAATVFREGHDAVGANVVLIDPEGNRRPPVLMNRPVEWDDRWVAEVSFDSEGDWSFQIEAWSDPFHTWRHNAEIKIPADIDSELVFIEAEALYRRAAALAPAAERDRLVAVASALRDTSIERLDRLALALAPDVVEILTTRPVRDMVTRSAKMPVFVQRRRALYSAWYELFPRSVGATLDPPRSGTFATAAARIPEVAAMGFDVLYLPPIHPVGHTFRKGPNNSLVAGPDDVGSPWAIGSEQGGHDAVNPDLGTIADFDAFVSTARSHGLEIALDLAIQCSPDHPWVHSHPEWFRKRPDGSIAYAENPPKKYQDIYPVNFDEDPDGIYAEILRIVTFWISHGVRIFRVDNPHTKPVRFWEWLITQVRLTDPDVIFLAEAFTSREMMRTLGKVGFDQSYTYFTWRTGKQELIDYGVELAVESAPYFRPNFFVNTPDILHAYLQTGGPAAFRIRAILAAMMSPSWGMYSGFELCEHVPVAEGSEEYMNSEKYQLRPRDFATAVAERRSLEPFIAELNRIRREHPALHELRNLYFEASDDDNILAFSKTSGDDTIIVVVNLDPHLTHETQVHLDLAQLGFGWDDRFEVRDELTGQIWDWGQHNYVRLDPFNQPAHILHVQRSLP